MMKNIFNKILALAVVFSIASCDSLLDINEDPDASTTARVQEVFTSGQAYLNYMVAAQFNDETPRLWAQYYAWGPGVAVGPDERNEYFATSSDSRWRYAYARSLRDLKFVIDSGEPLYGALAKITMAYEYGLLVDMFDAVPYSQALQGAFEDGSLTTPVYDDGATIYASLIASIDEALAQIENAAGNILIPGNDDLLYHGDLDAWTKFAYSLKLKLLVRQTVNGGPTDLSTQISDLVAEGLAGGYFIDEPSENAAIVAGGQAGSENPFYALLEQGLGNFYVLNQAFFEALDDLNDERLDEMYDKPGGSAVHVAEISGNVLNSDLQSADYSKPSDKVYGPALPTNLMTSTEVWFYRAEAAQRFGTEDAVSTFNSAVTSSFADLGIESDAAGHLAFINYGNATDRIKMLSREMWVAMNGTSQPGEGWITTRKFDNGSNGYFGSTGGLFISPVENTLGAGVYPSILLYPQTEVNTNPNFPGQHQLTDKVFWDN
ncbi:MAG: SusD/RagB family nutrient-binding outer membrane lipoprotein [Chitinophagales bacterium]